jgi:hypothetical protein
METRYPNFSPNDDIEDYRPLIMGATSTRTARFNENISGYVVRNARKGQSFIDSSLEGNNSEKRGRDRNAYWTKTAKLLNVQRSTSVLNIDKYIQTRGLNVTFEKDQKGKQVEPKKQMDIEKMIDNIFATPIVVAETNVIIY